jgi:hypothetical protein
MECCKHNSVGVGRVHLRVPLNSFGRWTRKLPVRRTVTVAESRIKYTKRSKGIISPTACFPNLRPSRLYYAYRGHVCKLCVLQKLHILRRLGIPLTVIFFHLRPSNQPAITGVALFRYHRDLDQCFSNLFTREPVCLRKITTDPHFLAHVTTEYPDDRYPKLKMYISAVAYTGI